MLNQCQFIGNLGRDPEIRTFTNGGKVANLRLAVSQKWKDRETGERKEKTEWVSIAVFSEPLVRVAEQYLRKGSRVFVSGQLETRKWQDQSGQDRYSTEVVLRPYRSELTMLDGKGERQEGSRDDSYQRPQGGAPAGGASDMGDEFDSEIPF